jgi:hypothetical protein
MPTRTGMRRRTSDRSTPQSSFAPTCAARAWARRYTATVPGTAEPKHYRAYAGIALPNPASVALHESIGFRPLGGYEKVGFKFGQWRDVGWWQESPQSGEPPQTWQSWKAAISLTRWTSVCSVGSRGSVAPDAFDRPVRS